MPTTEPIAHLFHILNASPLATAIYTDEHLKIAYVNEAMLQMWCSKESIIGKNFCDVFPNFKQEGFSTILKKVWQTGIPYKAVDTPADILDGETFHTRYFDFEYQPLLNDQRETYAILHTSIDVTARVQAQRLLEKHEQQLSINKDLEMITSILAHDAKNPLSIARLGISRLKTKNANDTKNSEKWYEIIDQAMEDLNTIIDRTVQLSEARSYIIKKDQIDIATKIQPWCEEAMLIHQTTSSNIKLGKLLPVYGDLRGLSQVFINIIGNAIKYSSSVANPTVEIYSEETNKGIVYYIKDNGVGIPQQDIQHIYQHLHRDSNSFSFQGKGIGLFIVKRVMERLEGMVNISSELNKGTEVRLFFPNS